VYWYITITDIVVHRRHPDGGAVIPMATIGRQCATMTTTPPHLTGALTIKEFCDAYRLCREKVYQEIRARRLRAVKLGRKTLILRADAEGWAASLPELRTVGREQASA
jgi:excisionase family DNA binding protein